MLYYTPQSKIDKEVGEMANQGLGKRSALTIYMAAFFAAAGLMLAACVCMGVYPFGDLTLIHADMDSQYAAFHSYFGRALRGEDSLIYSFAAGLGGSMIPLFAYYLASPLSLLAFFFTPEQVPELLLLLTVLKTGLVACAYIGFSRSVLKDFSWRPLVFALCYALCGWVLCYASNIMWMDALILLPLTLAAVTKLVRGGNPCWLVGAFAALFYTQFYIAYMVGFFSLMWLVGSLIVLKPRRMVRKTLLFAGCALLAAGLCAVILLPTGLRLVANAVEPAPSMADTWDITQTFDGLLMRSFSAYGSILGSAKMTPPLYSGIMCLLLFPAYLLNPGISKRERISVLVGAAFIMVSFCFEPLARAWQAFDRAECFPYRFAFLLIFLTVFSAHRCVMHLKTLRRWVLLSAAGLALGYLLIQKPTFALYTHAWIAPLTLVALVFWPLAYTARRTWPRLARPMAAVMALALGAELFLQSYCTFVAKQAETPFRPRAVYLEDIALRRALLEAVPGGLPDNSRFENTQYDAVNRNFALGIRGEQFFASTAQRSLGTALHFMGFLQFGIEHSLLGSSIVAESLLGIRYIGSKEAPNDYYVPIAQVGDVTLYENAYAFPLAFMAGTKVTKPYRPELYLANEGYYTRVEAIDPFEELNYLLSFLTEGERLKVFQEIPLDTYEDSFMTQEDMPDGTQIWRHNDPDKQPMRNYRLTAEVDAPLYGVWHVVQGTGPVTVLMDGEERDISTGERVTKVVYLGQAYPGDEIPLQARLDGETAVVDQQMLYWLDMGALGRLSDQLYGAEMTDMKLGKAQLTGRVKAGDDQVLFLSLPFDGGWRAEVDGREVPVQLGLGAFLAVPMEAGEHAVRLWYEPAGFVAGLMISGGCAVLFAGALFLSLFRRRHKKRLAVSRA